MPAKMTEGTLDSMQCVVPQCVHAGDRLSSTFIDDGARFGSRLPGLLGSERGSWLLGSLCLLTAVLLSASKSAGGADSR